MSDDLEHSPETQAKARLAGRVANAVFDKGLSGDLADFDAKVDDALADVQSVLGNDDGWREAERLRLFKLAVRIDRDAKRAICEGRPNDATQLKEEWSSLTRQIKILTAYGGFTAAAEVLHKAKDFDAFCAALPGVDLSRTYGGFSETFPPFPLIWAMEARDRPVERVQAMLRAGVRLDTTTKHFSITVLHWIGKSKRKGREKRLACVRLLVLKGAELEAHDFFGRTPLHVAIQEGSVDDMAVLLAAGADVRALSGDREFGPIDGLLRTVLMKAAHDPAKMQLLLDHGADPHQKAADGFELRLHIRQQMAMFARMLAEEPEKKRGSSLFAKYRDALAASLALVEGLMGARAADPDRKLTFREAPEAFYALQGDLPLDEYRATLARVDITTYSAPNGDCPIYWPIRAKVDRPQRLWLMLQAGASVEGDPGNGTALHILADQQSKNVQEQTAMVRMLIQAGAQLEAQDYAGLTPLARAVQRAAKAEVAALLAAGALVTASATLGYGQPRRVPLLAAAASHAKIFQLLLTHGANPDRRRVGRLGLGEWIGTEIARLEADLGEDMSGNLRRTWEQFLRGYRASQKMLVERRPAEA